MRQNKVNSKLLNSDLKEAIEKHGITQDTTIIFKHNKVKENEPFVKVFQRAIPYAISTMTPAGCKMVLYFLGASVYGNYVQVDQTIIGKELNLSRQSVNKGLKELLEFGMITVIQEPNDKRRNNYLINPFLAWKGNPSDRKKTITEGKERFTRFPQGTQISLILPLKSEE